MDTSFLSPSPAPVKFDSSSRPTLHHQFQSDDIRSISPLRSPPLVSTSTPAPSSTSGFLPLHSQTHVFSSPGLGGSNVPSMWSSHTFTDHLTPNFPSGLGYGPIRRLRSERRSVWSEAAGHSGGSAGGVGLWSLRASPSPNPDASPRLTCEDLPPSQRYDDVVGMSMAKVSGCMTGMDNANPSVNQHLSMQQQQQQAHNNEFMYGVDSRSHPQGVMLPSGLGPTQGGPIGGLAGQWNTVNKNSATTERQKRASVKRRKADATFVCPVPGCGSTFTRIFNLRGHMRSHNEEKPYHCRWPGCTKAFARQHDCKRHEALHANYRPFTCDGCQKQFARMDALNRHLRSEGGADCAEVQNLVSFPGSFEGQAMLNDIHLQDAFDGDDDHMEVEPVQMMLSENLPGNIADSSAKSSGAEEKARPVYMSYRYSIEIRAG